MDGIFARPARGVPGRTKDTTCNELGPVSLVDDSPEHLATLTVARGVLFGAYPWQTLPRTATWPRAKNWNELTTLL
jgi:hypothetical protein